MATKEILTVLKLDAKKFTSKLSDTEKGMLKFSAAATAIYTTMAALTKVAANYQDSMIKSARVAGTTAESFSSLGMAAEQSDVSLEQFQKSLVKLQDDKAQKSLGKMGISVKDVNGNARDSVEIFKDFAEYVKKIESPAQKTAAAVDVFGAKGANMINMLREGRDGLEAFEQKAQRFGLVVSTEAGEAAEKFNDNLDDIAQATKGLTNTIGESLVAFANESSMLDTIEGVITDITQGWKSLDKDTKDFIMTTVSLVGGIGIAVGAFLALSIAVKAFTAALIANPAVLIITGIVAALTALAVGFMQFRDKIMTALAPLETAFKDLGGVFENMKNAFDFGKTDENLKDTGRKVSVFGTIVVTVFKIIGAAVLVLMQSMTGLYNVIDMISVAATALVRSLVAALKFDTTGAEEWAEISTKAIELAGNEITLRSKQIKRDLDKIFAGGIVVFDDEKTKAAFDKIKKPTKDLPPPPDEGSISKWDKFLERIKKDPLAFAQNMIGLASTVTDSIGSIADSMADEIARTADIAIENMQVANATAKKIYEANKELAQSIQDEELENLTNSYDAQIQALKDREAKKQTIIENAAIERQLALDKEFQAEKARMEAEFAAYVENERLKFEEKKKILDEETADNEQRKLVDQMLEADYNMWLENETARLEESITNLGKTFDDKRKENDTLAKEDQKKRAEKTAKKIADLEKDKDDAITKTTEKFLENMKALDRAEEKRETTARRKQLEAEWQRDVQVFEQTRVAKIAAATAAGASAIAQAYAQSLAATAPLFPVGIGIASTISGLITASTAAQINSINNSKPRKPAELRMATGGVLSGAPHAAGGVNLEAEGGEGFLDVNRTKKFLNIADNMMDQFSGNGKANKVVNINFGERAVVVNDVNAMVPEVVGIINRELAADVRRRIAV